MKSTSTTKLNLPGSYIECFRKLQTVSQQNNVNYMLVGAHARDIVFEHYLGVTSQRLTTDIDIGLSVDTWETFKKFKSSLVDQGFQENSKSQQRLSYGVPGNPTNEDPVQLDVVPHGGINDPNNDISWPPDGSMKMSVLGFQEAYDSALTISIDENLDIRVISVTGLALLKLIAWIDRPSNLRQKDALDLKFSLLNYEALPNIQDQVFDEGFAEQYNFEMHKAAAAKFGSDVQSISSPACNNFINDLAVASLLTNCHQVFRLADDNDCPLSNTHDTPNCIDEKLRQTTPENCHDHSRLRKYLRADLHAMLRDTRLPQTLTLTVLP